MNKFGKQLKQVRLALDLKQKDIASFMGITPTAVSDYESGKRVPSLDSIIKLADRYAVSLSWLITGEGDMYIGTLTREAEPAITIPVCADIAAGIGIEADDIEPQEHVCVTRELLAGYAPPFYCFRVNGASMEPEIHTGDYAIISAWQFDTDYNGSLCAFRSVDGLLIKRLAYDIRGKRALLVPVNPKHPIIEYDENSADIQIIGRLVAVIRKY